LRAALIDEFDCKFALVCSSGNAVEGIVDFPKIEDTIKNIDGMLEVGWEDGADHLRGASAGTGMIHRNFGPIGRNFSTSSIGRLGAEWMAKLPIIKLSPTQMVSLATERALARSRLSAKTAKQHTEPGRHFAIARLVSAFLFSDAHSIPTFSEIREPLKIF